MIIAYLTYTLIVQTCYGWGYNACVDRPQASGLTYSQCVAERRYWLAGGRNAYCELER
jgi:hypothetical protein